jgi:hypothetical protein
VEKEVRYSKNRRKGVKYSGERIGRYSGEIRMI